MGKIKFYVLGRRGTRPMTGKEFEVFGGATSCYIITIGDHAVILDCGTGLYQAKKYLHNCRQIDILITHLHYDHILGFLHSAIFPPDANVRIYFGEDGNLNTDGASGFSAFLKDPHWPVSPSVGQITFINYNRELILSPQISVRFAAANHPNQASVIRVNTNEGNMSLICDWEHGGKVLPEYMTENCDFVLYDGMYTDSEYETHIGWGHSTWNEGIKLVKEYNIPKLIITHHHPDRTDKEITDMETAAKQVYSGIRFARCGDCYSMKGEKLL